MGVTLVGDSSEALARSTELVRAYADSSDGNIAAEVAAVLDEIGRDRAELQNLVASLAGLAGHAVRAIVVRLEADLGVDNPATRLPSLSERRRKVLVDCADALRSWADKRERRSGLDRRLAPDRRRVPSGDPVEQINLRLYGERRVGPADRRSGVERRGSAEATPPLAVSPGATRRSRRRLAAAGVQRARPRL